MPNQTNKKAIVVAVFFLLLPWAARAGFLDDLNNAQCLVNGECSLADIENGFTLLIKYLLATLASVSLLYFIYGALNWMMSSGRPERVKRGSDIMTQAIIGLVIAFGSYLLVSFFINDILKAKDPQNQNLTSYIDQSQSIAYYKK